MDAIDIQNAIMARIRDIADRPSLIYPDEGVEAPLPRWVLEVASSTSRGLLINKALTETDAEVMVRVETASGDYGAESGSLVKKLLAAFPVSEKFSGVRIATPPKVQAPYSTGASYAVPVIIRARAY